MKVYAVQVQRDGHTVKAPGVSETVIRKEEFLFAADNINRVWEAIDFIRNDPEAHLIGVWEQHPAIQVLNGTTAAGRNEK
jgi:hypothetical protein